MNKESVDRMISFIRQCAIRHASRTANSLYYLYDKDVKSYDFFSAHAVTSERIAAGMRWNEKSRKLHSEHAVVLNITKPERFCISFKWIEVSVYVSLKEQAKRL